MPHVPQDFRPAPPRAVRPVQATPGSKAPLVTGDAAIEDLPLAAVDPPRENKPRVPLSRELARVRKHGLDRLSMRTFEKSPTEIQRFLEGRG